MQQTCSSQELALPLEGFVKLPGLMNVTQLSRSTIYAEVKKGTFPAPIKLSERSVAWPVESVRAWIAQRIEASRGTHTGNKQ